MDDSDQDIDITPVNSTQPSRPGTPDSSLTNSFHQANAAINDLTANLSKVSRAPTPDASNLLRCCCGRDDCENTKAWIAHQAKLESRLILSAEVGQALLQKHEAYVRRNEVLGNRAETDKHEALDSSPDMSPNSEAMLGRINQLMKENSALEKRLNAALLNNEVSEASTKVLVQELEEAKATVSRLTLNQAKSAGWEVRLNNVTQERDDIKQELDVERQRVKSSEGHIAVLKERCTKMQAEIGQLHEDLERQKCSRTELSEEILRDARARLQMLLQARFGRTTVTDQPEVTEVMESLVAENEALKRDIAELQNLLTEAREDVRTLREEMEEVRAHIPVRDASKAIPAYIRTHHHSTSWGSSFGQDFRSISSPGLQLSLSSQVPVGHRASPLVQRRSSDNGGRRSSSIERSFSNRSYEPPTPATSHRPLSPADSNTPSEVNVHSVTSPRPSYPASHLSIDVEKGHRDVPIEAIGTGKPRTPRRPLFLLTQTRGVQTDPVFWPSPAVGGSSLRPPSFSDRTSSTPPPEGHSESSSVVDPNTSTIAALVDRVNTLFNRLIQSDARTLTNRLKRQHLTGADVGHLSRTTINAIIGDVNMLRRHFRGVLEDEKVVSTCTRRDFRALLTLFKEMFTELGQIRLTLNDVILDPSIALKVSEAAMNPSKVEDVERSKSPMGASASLGSWMAPITKLFGASSVDDKPGDQAPGPSRPTPGTPHRQRRHFTAAKQAPALAATTIAVNVEFSGVGTGRAVSTTGSSLPQPVAIQPPTIPESTAKGVMGIFAGAPRPANGDTWVVVGPRSRLRGGISTNNLRTTTISRAAGRRISGQRLSRNVDAIVDADSVVHDSDDENDGDDADTTLLERTLRPRGLSDSSIRSTFLESMPKVEGSVPTTTPISTTFDGRPSVRQGAYSSKHSVLASLGKRMQLFKGSAPSPNATISNKRGSIPTTTPGVSSTGPTTSIVENPNSSEPSKDSDPASAPLPTGAASPRRLDLIPSLASWAAATAGLDGDLADAYVGSVQADSMLHASRSPPMGRAWRGGREMDFE